MFNYNPEILELLKGESCVICSPLGSGKTQSVKEYIATSKSINLIVVNDIEAQESFVKDIENYCVVYNSKEEMSFKQAITIVRQNRANSLVITKSKFNRLLSVESEILDEFDKIILDEASGLNPIQMSRTKNAISDISAIFEEVMLDCGEEILEKYLVLTMYIRHLYKTITESKEHSQFYKEGMTPSRMKYADGLYKDIKRLYDEHKLHSKTEHLIQVFNLLDAIRTDNLYLGEYMNKKERVINFLYANTFLEERIRNTRAKIIVLDATANLNKYIYRKLGLKIKYLEEKKYPNLVFHIHKYKHITDALGRANDEVTAKIAEDIVSSGRGSYLTFCTKSKENLLTDIGLEKVDYVFSGRDIGSNVYMDETELNLVYSQTFPIHFRSLYNAVILDIRPYLASNPVEVRKTETRLMTERLVQLIGRTAIRQDSNAKVNVHFYCVDQDKIERTQDYFGIPDSNVIIYDIKDIGVAKKSVTIEEVLNTIEFHLQLKFSGYEIDLKEIIRNRLYSPETKNATISSWYIKEKYKSQIIALAKKYKAEFYIKQGRKGGGFIKF